MIHFRLRRPLRLAVDFLSFSFAESILDSHSAPNIMRGVHGNASTIPNPSPLPPPNLASGPRSDASVARWLPSRKQAVRRGRRRLAAFPLLLALSLEAGGCNPAQDITHSREPSASKRQLREITRAEQNVSFYDPAESPDNAGDTHLLHSALQFDFQQETLEAKPLPWAIPESVFFVYRGGANRQQILRPNEQQHYQPPVATAFVLSVPARTHNRFVRFLVTARHVVDPRWAHCAERNPASIDVRLNRRAGGVGYETVPLLSGSERRFYIPSDSTADLAVIPLDQTLISHLDDYKFLDVPYRLLPTQSEMRLVHDNQPIMTAGLPPRPSGEFTTYPLFDAGFLRKMPSEAVGVQCGTAQNFQSEGMPIHIWFISAGLPQGVSGAPVYTFVMRDVGAIKAPVLLGIQSVAWPDKGVAGITPSTILDDLVRSAVRQSKLDLDFYRGPSPKP